MAEILNTFERGGEMIHENAPGEGAASSGEDTIFGTNARLPK